MDSQRLQTVKNKYDIIGNDAALNRALEMAVAIAPTDLTVLVTGESGVGKENIPKIIHQNSRRRNNKYFAVNCGAIPEGTADSELFGHEKGAFTGAIEARKGYFEEYDGGTLFLDEVGELPLASQARLLRVLQSGEFVRVGSAKVQKTDVRVIAATNVDLLHAVSQGKFREDLYYRLNAVQITVPPLRERKEDIYLFFRKFSTDASEKWGMRKVTLTSDAVSMLINYRWPGNIRQLKNVAETVTALESERLVPGSDKCVVDASALARYMPKEDSMLPALVPGEGKGGSMSESDKQEILGYIYRLKQEVDRLKAVVGAGGASVQAADPAGRAVVQPGPSVARPIVERDPSEQNPFPGSDPSVIRPGVGQEDPEEQLQEDQKYGGYSETPQASGTVIEIHGNDHGKSLREIERDNIYEALRAHKGNRKLASRQLGISDRTIYRKIKQFNLENINWED